MYLHGKANQLPHAKSIHCTQPRNQALLFEYNTLNSIILSEARCSPEELPTSLECVTPNPHEPSQFSQKLHPGCHIGWWPPHMPWSPPAPSQKESPLLSLQQKRLTKDFTPSILHGIYVNGNISVVPKAPNEMYHLGLSAFSSIGIWEATGNILRSYFPSLF